MSRKYRIGNQQHAEYDAALDISIRQQQELDRLQDEHGKAVATLEQIGQLISAWQTSGSN
jgi:hypothetical protein